MSTDTKVILGAKKLVFVEGRDGKNNNKVYNMYERGDGQFEAHWGRADPTKQDTLEETYLKITVYPMSKWDSTLRSKVKKGYEDMTELFHVESKDPSKPKVEKDIFNIADSEIKRIMKLLSSYSNKSVKENYEISSESVTVKMVDRAQEIIDEIVGLIKVGTDKDAVNEKLLSLYKVIPRKMAHVGDYLLEENINKDTISVAQDLLGSEQDTLDVMRGQVKMNAAQDEEEEEDGDDKPSGTIVDLMGLKMEAVTDKATIDMIKKKMGPESNMFKSAFRVKNEKTFNKFDKYRNSADNKTVELYWHGSRNENWLSIMEGGLVLRPSNAVITGKMFGQSTYFSDKFKKSLGYTSLRGSYWANGSSDKAFLALYSVHVGNQYHIKKWEHSHSQLTEERLKRLGDYDSVFAHGGADLRNNEYMVYNENQTTIEYLVEVS